MSNLNSVTASNSLNQNDTLVVTSSSGSLNTSYSTKLNLTSTKGVLLLAILNNDADGELIAKVTIDGTEKTFTFDQLLNSANLPIISFNSSLKIELKASSSTTASWYFAHRVG